MSIVSTISQSISKVGLFWQERTNSRIFRWNLLVIGIEFFYAWYKYGDLPPQIPLFYSRPWGEEQLAGSLNIFLLPIFSLVFLLINNLLAVFFLKSISLLSRLLVILSLIFSIFSLVAVYHSISLVG